MNTGFQVCHIFGMHPFIKEEGKYLRVILLEDEETVHNAFFDRGFKEIDNEN